MEFIFVCPEQTKTFKSTNFRFIENRGVTTDSSGNKMLDVWVELCEACPSCGKKHTYHASKLAWPVFTRIFSSSKARSLSPDLSRIGAEDLEQLPIIDMSNKPNRMLTAVRILYFKFILIWYSRLEAVIVQIWISCNLECYPTCNYKKN